MMGLLRRAGNQMARDLKRSFPLYSLLAALIAIAVIVAGVAFSWLAVLDLNKGMLILLAVAAGVPCLASLVVLWIVYAHTTRLWNSVNKQMRMLVTCIDYQTQANQQLTELKNAVDLFNAAATQHHQVVEEIVEASLQGGECPICHANLPESLALRSDPEHHYCGCPIPKAVATHSHWKSLID